MQKTDRESTSLRDGRVDLETGVIGKASGPEVRTQALFRDRFVGVVRSGHALARAKMTIARYAKAQHVATAHGETVRGPVEQALEPLGAARDIVCVAGTFSAALALARDSDLVATVPERQTGVLREGLHSFVLPFAIAPFTVSLMWHPRLDADPAHRWLRALVREVCAGQ